MAIKIIRIVFLQSNALLRLDSAPDRSSISLKLSK